MRPWFVGVAVVATFSCAEAPEDAVATADEAVVVGGRREDDLHVAVQLVGAVPARAQRHGDHVDFPDALGPGFDLVREIHGEAIEDFVRLPRPIAASQIRYRVRTKGVAGLRLVERTLELLDASGTPRVRMDPPWIADRGGAKHDVHVRVHGCAVDEDPRAPWGRAPTPPGAAACVVELSWALDSTAYPALLDPNWTPCGDLATARGTHAATLLANGRVLVSGGYSNALGGDVASSELFDPTTKTFAATGALPSPRRAHVTTRLSDGRVVAVGGDVGLGAIAVLADVARYDPTTGVWSSVTALATPRTHATVTRLSSSGELVIAGGLPEYTAPSSIATASVEICAKEGAPCRATTPMNEARADHSATELSDGRILVAGGGVRIFDQASSLHATSTIFDPVGEGWSNGPSLPAARFGHIAIRNAGGTVFLVGGALSPQGEAIASDVLGLAPGAPSFTVAGALTAPRWLHGSSLLPSGKLLVVGTATAFYQPSTLAETEVFDPITKSSQLAGDLTPRYLHTMTTLADGRVLVTGGGSTTESQKSAHVYEEPRPPSDAGTDARTDAATPEDASTPPSTGDAADRTDAGASPSATDTTGFYACTIQGTRPASAGGALAWLLATCAVIISRRAKRPRRPDPRRTTRPRLGRTAPRASRA